MYKLALISLLSLTVVACTSSPQPVVQTSTTGPVTSSASSSAASSEITLEELKAFNGKNGAKCYIAISGKVYDMSESPLWQNGEHQTSQGRAKCGEDLTQVLQNDAPASHRASNYPSEFPVVGTLN